MAETQKPEELVWRDRFEGPLRLWGLGTAEGETFPLCRLPEAVRRESTEAVQMLSYHTSGVRLRFRTDATCIALRARLREGDVLGNGTPRAIRHGFDLYVDERYVLSFIAPGEGRQLEGQQALSPGWKSVTVHFPLYNGVEALEIGLPPEARLEEAPPLTVREPLVFYGSSITQGACASRPGNSYVAMLCRALDADFINLGFSGSARGEPVLAAFIAGLRMSAFVLDYDHNAPSPEHLERTHYPFYRRVRESQPDLPILMLSKCDALWAPEDAAARRAIIQETYRRALAEGDTHVGFIDGAEFFGTAFPDDCSADGTHPNDLGFSRMAQRIEPALRALLFPA